MVLQPFLHLKPVEQKLDLQALVQHLFLCRFLEYMRNMNHPQPYLTNRHYFYFHSSLLTLNHYQH